MGEVESCENLHPWVVTHNRDTSYGAGHVPEEQEVCDLYWAPQPLGHNQRDEVPKCLGL